MNEDPRLPSLRVPVFYTPARTDHAPPANMPAFEAEYELYLLLVDIEMVAADARSGGDAWGAFAADLWSRSQDPSGSVRCIPVMLDGSAWNLAPKALGDASFLRAGDDDDEVIHRAIHELCRLLLGSDRGEESSPAPVCLFLSHAKRDLRVDEDHSPVHLFWRFLNEHSPVQSWVDSTAIPAGANARTAILSGVRESTFIAFETDEYSSRSWCQEEVLAAKRLMRPMVRVDALKSGARRSFPYLGNLPTTPWHPEAPDNHGHVLGQRLVTLALKETLRAELAKRRLERCKQPSDRVIPRGIELLDAAQLRRASGFWTALYPDPPYGNPESELLRKEGLEFTTPMERLVRGQRSLAGREVALSFSDATDIGWHGMGHEQLQQAALDLCLYLLVQGARLTYGGHLQAGGFTVELLDLVRRHNSWAQGVGDETLGLAPIHIYLGWPLRAADADYARYKGLARITEVPMPEAVGALGFTDSPPSLPGFAGADDVEGPQLREAWARGMSAMRRVSTDAISARILIGGQMGRTPAQKSFGPGGAEAAWYKGMIPGVVEEALLVLRSPTPKPLFLIGAFGGATRLLIDLLRGRARREWSFDWQCSNPWYREMAERLGAQVRETDHGLVDGTAGEWTSYSDIAQELADVGADGLRNGLSPDENLELFYTRSIDRMVELISTGLGRQG